MGQIFVAFSEYLNFENKINMFLFFQQTILWFESWASLAPRPLAKRS